MAAPSNQVALQPDPLSMITIRFNNVCSVLTRQTARQKELAAVIETLTELLKDLTNQGITPDKHGPILNARQEFVDELRIINTLVDRASYNMQELGDRRIFLISQLTP